MSKQADKRAKGWRRCFSSQHGIENIEWIAMAAVILALLTSMLALTTPGGRSVARLMIGKMSQWVHLWDGEGLPSMSGGPSGGWGSPADGSRASVSPSSATDPSVAVPQLIGSFVNPLGDDSSAGPSGGISDSAIPVVYSRLDVYTKDANDNWVKDPSVQDNGQWTKIPSLPSGGGTYQGPSDYGQAGAGWGQSGGAGPGTGTGSWGTGDIFGPGAGTGAGDTGGGAGPGAGTGAGDTGGGAGPGAGTGTGDTGGSAGPGAGSGAGDTGGSAGPGAGTGAGGQGVSGPPTAPGAYGFGPGAKGEAGGGAKGQGKAGTRSGHEGAGQTAGGEVSPGGIGETIGELHKDIAGLKAALQGRAGVAYGTGVKASFKVDYGAGKIFVKAKLGATTGLKVNLRIDASVDVEAAANKMIDWGKSAVKAGKEALNKLLKSWDRCRTLW